jgi:hypothetical protein
MSNAGEGGLDELSTHLVDNLVQFAVLEVVVTDEDDYNAIKFVLITWIGPDVPAGLAKARAAGHRKDLIDFIQVRLAQ